MFENEERKVVVCADCGCEIDLEDAVEIDGEYYCEDCTFTCAYCGDLCIKSEHECTEIDGEIWCDNCRDDNAFYCEHCGEYYSMVHYDSYSVIVTRNGATETWCTDCYYNDAGVCEDCGERFESDLLEYNEDNDCYYCEECYENNNNKLIRDYHSRPTMNFIGATKKQWNGLQHYVGLELEVDKGEDRNDCAKELADIEENIYFNRDGSLDNGFEIITQPHTEEALYKIEWQKIFDTCKKYGFKSHDAETCGLHIHVSRQWFGRKKETQDLAIRKLILFYNAYWGDILKLSRRTNAQAEQWARNYCVDNRQELVDGIKKGYYGRYYAINNCNYHTVEFRLGRGTLNAQSFYAWIDFNLTLVKNCKKLRLNDLTNPSKWLKGLKPTTIQYLKEKGVFVNDL